MLEILKCAISINALTVSLLDNYRCFIA